MRYPAIAQYCRAGLEHPDGINYAIKAIGLLIQDVKEGKREFTKRKDMVSSYGQGSGSRVE